MEADPTMLEAALRLGHVLTMQRQYAEGASQLERVLQSSPAVRVGYLARLFLGAEMERRGKWPEAIAHYEAAVSLLPGTQAARTALAFALVQAGRADEARGIVDTGLQPGLPRSPLDDPFWEYKFGPMIDAQALLLGLFRSVAR
jgi:tetratricopeptide (TPR) repeat protein